MTLCDECHGVLSRFLAPGQRATTPLGHKQGCSKVQASAGADVVRCEACGGSFDRTISPRCFCGWGRSEDVERFEKEAARQRERVGAVIPYRDRPPVATVRPLHPVVEGLIHLAGGCACEVVWWVQTFRESGLPVAIVRTRARRSVE